MPGEAAARKGHANFPADFARLRPGEAFTAWRVGSDWEIETILNGKALFARLKAIEEWENFSTSSRPEMRVHMKKTIKSCGMCANAYTDSELSSHNDLSYISIGTWAHGYRAFLRSGDGQPTELVFETSGTSWKSIGFYRPKFCPNCGRELAENARYEQKKKGAHHDE